MKINKLNSLYLVRYQHQVALSKVLSEAIDMVVTQANQEQAK